MKKLLILSILAIGIMFKGSAQSRVYIHTDRDIYQAGERIQFKAYTNMQTALSGSFKLDVYLVDQNGSIVSDNSFLVSGVTFTESIDLPGSLSDGQHKLIGKFQNMPIEQAFEKEILIHEFQIPSVLFEMQELNMAYRAGELVEIPVSLKSPDGIGLKKKNFTYAVKANGNDVETGKARTDKNGLDLISFVYPDMGDNVLVTLECMVEESGYLFSNGLIVPSKELPILVNFFPEGGILIDGYDNKVGFTAYSLYGEPINIKGELIGPENQVIKEIQTLTPGLGEFEVTADARVPLRLRLLDSVWSDIIIDLPRINSNGLVLKYTDKKSNNLVFSAKNPIKDTYMSLTVRAEQFGNEFYSKKLLVESEKLIQVPMDLCITGIVSVSIVNDRGEIMARRSVYHWKDSFQIPVFESLSGSIVDAVFSPKWSTTLPLGEWLNLGPELAIKNIPLDFLDAFMLCYNPSSVMLPADTPNEENFEKTIEELYRIGHLDQFISELKVLNFYNKHFLSDELEFGKFYSENRMALDEMGFLPKKMSAEERVQRQLDQGKSVLSVIKTIRAYKIVNNQLVFRGSADSFNDPGGSIIVIDGIPKGANIQVLQNLSPFDVASIKVSASISDIMKYAGMEDTAGVVIIETRKAGGESVKKELGPTQRYSPTLLWNPNYRGGAELAEPERVLKGKVWINKA